MSSSSNSNGRGAMAWNAIQVALLAIAMAMGGWVVNSVKSQGESITALTYQLKTSNDKLDAMASAYSRNRWTVQNQIQYNSALGAANATLRVPDVRNIVRDAE